MTELEAKSSKRTTGFPVRIKNGISGTIMEYRSITALSGATGLTEIEIELSLVSSRPVILPGLFEVRYLNDSTPWADPDTPVGLPKVKGTVYVHVDGVAESYPNATTLRRERGYTQAIIRKSVISGGRITAPDGAVFTKDGVICRRPLKPRKIIYKVKAINGITCKELVLSSIVELSSTIGLSGMTIYRRLGLRQGLDGWVFIGI